MPFSELDLLLRYRFRNRHPVLVDAGAHHGLFSRAFARRGWRVVAFEPEAKNRAAFERNLARYRQVTCLPRAVSDVSGAEVPFYVSDTYFGIHALQPFHASHQPAARVETIRLTDALAMLGIDAVTLLKIDIEGADFLALRGLDFGRYRPELAMIEFMDERSTACYGYTHHDVARYMGEQGYATFVSEWAPITEYAREGVAGDPHRWLVCQRYPLDHEPAWGNLIFVPEHDVSIFTRTLQRYLHTLDHGLRPWVLELLRRQAARVPGLRRVYHRLWG